MRRFSTPLPPRFFGSLLCVLVLSVARDDVRGQELPSALKSGDPASLEVPKKEPLAGSLKLSADGGLQAPSIRYLPNKSGELVAVPNNATLEEYYKFLMSQNKPVAGPPASTISLIEIVGVADDERANLKVAFTIRLQQADQFVSVPLFLNEAVLKQWTYRGDGEESPVEKKDSESGYVWWFRGRGPHRLELSVSVPWKKQLPARRLVLSLPPSPISRAQLTLPYPAVNAKVIREQTITEVKPAGNGKAVVDAIDLGTRFDLTWSPTVEVLPSDISLEAQTTILAQIEADHVLLRADQQVKSLQGLFERIVVRLPTGAEFVKLDDSEKQSYKFDPKDRQNVVVSLKEKANSAQLNWTLRLATRIGTPMTLDGFAVEGARKQVGKIGLAIAEGLRFPSEPRDPSVLRINAGEFPANLGPVIRAYQFLNQPFKLPAIFDDVKPYFQVKPQLLLTAWAHQLVLDGEFEFRVDRDSLHEVLLTWPEHKSEGWTIDAVDEPGVVESYSIDDKGQITVRLVKHQPGTFKLRLRAHRPLKAGDDVAFSLPRPKSASRLSPSTVILANAENVETELETRGETLMHLLPASRLESLTLPESVRGLKATAYRVDTDEQSFGLRVTPQKQRIRTESLTEARWQDNQFRLVQKLTYDVSYERLSQIRVTIPTTLNPERVRFFTSRDVELSPEPLLTAAGAPRQMQLKLGEPQLGRFEIQARFSVPLVKESAFDTDAAVALPILGSVDEPFSETRVSLVQSDWFDAEPVSSETWRPQLNFQEAWRWLADGSPAALPLKLVRSTHANGTGNVSHALLTVHLDATGQGSVRAQFRVTTRATALPVTIPRTANPAKFYWDQRQLSDRECVESPPGSRQYSILLPEQPDATLATEHLLTVDYQDRFGTSFGWSERLELRSPQLPMCLWDARIVWQAVLPSDQHLLTYPPSATPMFRWQRTGCIWSRKSDLAPDQLQQWVAAETMRTPPAFDILIPEGTANVYTFSQFGSPQPLTFRTLSRPMVVLFGAGFSLAVGFIMLRLVVLRHVMTLLATSLIIAICGLWYSAPMELLVQPMIAGLVFPATAVLLESWIRRRNDNAVLSFAGQGDFPPMQAFGSHYAVRQNDPNEDTVHRPASRDSQLAVPIESGSGVS